MCDGPLMCETQNEARSEMHKSEDSDNFYPNNTNRRYRGGGPRFTDAKGVEYRLIRNRNKRTTASDAHDAEEQNALDV